MRSSIAHKLPQINRFLGMTGPPDENGKPTAAFDHLKDVPFSELQTGEVMRAIVLEESGPRGGMEGRSFVDTLAAEVRGRGLGPGPGQLCARARDSRRAQHTQSMPPHPPKGNHQHLLVADPRPHCVPCAQPPRPPPTLQADLQEQYAPSVAAAHAAARAVAAPTSRTLEQMNKARAVPEDPEAAPAYAWTGRAQIFISHGARVTHRAKQRSSLSLLVSSRCPARLFTSPWGDTQTR